jgi:hypothetical protein
MPAFQVFEPFDPARHARDRAVRSEPGEREFHEHEAEVGEIALQQPHAFGVRHVRKTHRQVALRHAPARAGQACGQHAKPATERNQRAIGQFRDQAHDAEADPGRPMTGRKQGSGRHRRIVAGATAILRRRFPGPS